MQAIEHIWPLIRTEGQLDRVIHNIEQNPGIVLYTVINADIRRSLEEGCRRLQVPHIHALDTIIKTMAGYLGEQAEGHVGAHHRMDEEYFERIEAIHYTLSHDDGQSAHDLSEADVVIVGVSRTSKTPTCVYLANKGIKAANVPFVPDCPLPGGLDELKRPLVIGLTKDPNQLVSIRKNRLQQFDEIRHSNYIDPMAVREEVMQAQRLFRAKGWKFIDVTKRSIEETSALILQLWKERQEART